MDIHERLKAIYDNCLAHMTDTPEDWERAFNALNGAVKNAGSKPEDVHEALKYYDLLEKQVGRKI